MNMRKAFTVELVLILVQLSFIKTLVALDADSDPILNGFSPPTDENNDLDILKVEIEEIKERIKMLKIASDDDANLKRRVDSLESKTSSLQSIFDRLTRRNDKEEMQTGNQRESIRTLTDQVDRLRGDLDEVKRQLDARLKLDRQSLLRDSVVDDIKSRDFDGAARKLRDLDGPFQKHVNRIVHDAYANDEGNFDLVMQFGSSEHLNASVSLAVYRALNFEMESNSHNDYLKVLKLIRGLNENVIERARKSAGDGEVAKALRNNLGNVAKLVATSKLTREIQANNYEAVSLISKNIYINYPVLFKEVIPQVINKVLDEGNKRRLVDFFSTHEYQSQSVFGYSAIFNELKNRSKLDQPLLVTLAFHLSRAMNATEAPSSLNEGVRLKYRLPVSVRNLAFSARVCIKNEEYQEYMYAASDGFKDGDSRRVFTWIPGKRVMQGGWSIEPKSSQEDRYLVRNVEHDEYMYAVVYEQAYHDTLRKVLTSRLRGDVAADQAAWTFEPSGDGVYIKNSLYDEYLFAYDEKTYDDERRYVRTWMPKGKRRASLWSIENCDHLGQVYRLNIRD